MRGRYTGTIPTTFAAPVGELKPGDVFDLPTGAEKRFLQHGLVEPSDKAAKELYAHMTAPPEPLASAADETSTN